MADEIFSTGHSNWLGFDPTNIPSFEDFLASDTTNEPQYEADVSLPPWAAATWNCVSAIASRCGIIPLVIEVSVIQDERRLKPGELSYFMSNVVCGAEAPDRSKVVQAYQSAIAHLNNTGSILTEKTFHLQHCIVAKASRSNLGDEWKKTSAFKAKVSNILSQGVDKKLMEQNCHDFLSAFLACLSPNYGPFGQCVYVAVPFQRPAISRAETVGQKHPTVPGGAIFAIFRMSNPLEEQQQQVLKIEEFVNRLRYMMDQANLMESFRFLDVKLANEKAMERNIMVYDSIGHTLRAFVEATAYRGAENELRIVKKEPGLSSDAKSKIARAQRSLSFFEHAESLGSLLRLQGWVHKRSDSHADRELQINKILSCYRVPDVEVVKRGKKNTELLDGYVQLCAALSAVLASKDRVTFVIAELGDGFSSRVIKTCTADDSADKISWMSRINLPPLEVAGDQIAVLLALSVAFLEPLRNASIYLNGIKKDSWRDQVPPHVQVLLQILPEGKCRAYVGNPLFENETSEFILARVSNGVRLVSGLLEENFLGKIQALSDEEAKILPRQKEYENPDISYLWQRIDANPLELYSKAMLRDL